MVQETGALFVEPFGRLPQEFFPPPIGAFAHVAPLMDSIRQPVKARINVRPEEAEVVLPALFMDGTITGRDGMQHRKKGRKQTIGSRGLMHARTKDGKAKGLGTCVRRGARMCLHSRGSMATVCGSKVRDGYSWLSRWRCHRRADCGCSSGAHRYAPLSQLDLSSIDPARTQRLSKMSTAHTQIPSWYRR